MFFDILTIFPNLLKSPLEEGILRQAIKKEQIDIAITNLRDFCDDRHQMTDDRPFGGGEGMVMKIEPLVAATRSVCNKAVDSHVILLSPQGKRLDQQKVESLAEKSHLVLVCGRYEGVDERYITSHVDEEISVGDYILTGGELGALMLVDSVTRILPGVLGCSDSAEKDTFSRNLLKHPQYTRPREFEGQQVPTPLLSGDHQAIEEYRFIEAVKRTLTKRPDLIRQERFSKLERRLLKKHNLYEKIIEVQHKST